MVSCPKCQTLLEKQDRFCPSCGFEVDLDDSVDQNKVVYVDDGTGYNLASYPNPAIRFSKDPAPVFDRFLAFVCDMFIVIILLPFFGLGIVYFLFKDGINGGRSIGKGIMNIRVIRYETRQPANFADSFGRNFGLIFAPTLFLEHEHRHLSDLVAGTMVVKDK